MNRQVDMAQSAWLEILSRIKYIYICIYFVESATIASARNILNCAQKVTKTVETPHSALLAGYRLHCLLFSECC